MQRVGALLWPKFPCLQVYGANTDVGKTIVSTLLCHAWSKKRRTHYLKPISTGALEDADDRYGISFSLDLTEFRSVSWMMFDFRTTLSGCL